MSFLEIRLPVTISTGVTGGSRFKTNILELSSGHEKRNIEWSLVKGEWDIGYAIKDKTEKNQLQNFFHTVQGRANGFRFRDWADYQLDRQVIGTTDGSTAIYQVFKQYSFGASTFDRNLTKIVADVDTESLVLRVWVNNILLTEGVGTSEFQIDRTTGIVTIGSTHAATSTQDIEIECEFDIPVRFDTDKLEITIVDPQYFDWQSIPVVEIRDIT